MDKLNLKFKKIFINSKYKNIKVFNPHKHWIVILYVFFASFFSLIFLSVYLFIEIKNENIFHENIGFVPKDSLIVRNKKLLNEVENYFTNKKTNLDLLKSESLKIEDPRFIK